MASLRVAAAAAAVSALSAARDAYSCNVIGSPDVQCLLPFPDNFYLSTAFSPSAAPGMRFSNETFPIDDEGRGIDPFVGGWNQLEGFSPMGPYMAYIPGLNLDQSGLPRLWNMTDASHNSVILNTETMQPVGHWVELDHSGDASNPGREYERATIFWPSARLNDSTRYIVAFRGLLDDDGLPITASDGFVALRDKVPTSNPALEASRPRFEAIFATLASLGWQRSSLTLAWDFTTNSQTNLTGRFVAMRDDAFQRLNNGASMQYTINTIQDNPRTGIARSIQGSFEAPLYLNSPLPGIHSRLVLDPATGLPVYQGLAYVNFTVLIPSSLAGNATVPPHPGMVLQYGHGLFGDQGEVNTGYLDEEANEYGYVLVAVDWWGLCSVDEPFAAIMIATDFTNFAMIPDRLHQGMLNALLAMKLLKQSSFNRDPAVTYGGVSVINPNATFYYGNSQGGIMGQVYMAVTTDVLRGVSGVGGGPYGLLLPRSSDFAVLFDVVRARYPRPIDAITIMPVIQALWDRMDPAGYLNAISRDVLPNTPAHTILFQAGLGDAQVSWLGVETSARSAGSFAWNSMVREGNETLFGFKFVADSTVITGTGNNVITMWDFEVPQVPFVNVPPPDQYDTHEKTRRTQNAQIQMAHFFTTGQVINPCGGPCIDPNGTALGHFV